MSPRRRSLRPRETAAGNQAFEQDALELYEFGIGECEAGLLRGACEEVVESCVSSRYSGRYGTGAELCSKSIHHRFRIEPAW